MNGAMKLHEGADYSGKISAGKPEDTLVDLA
jgi:hypothetical protein